VPALLLPFVAGGEARILFFMLHAGYIRHFRFALEELLDRGHSVHLAFTVLEKDPGDASLSTELAERWPNLTYGDAPRRSVGDGWAPLAMLTRSLVDLGRYTDPRYSDAPELRARMARKLTQHVQTARAIDPVSRQAVLRLVRGIANGTDANRHERLLRALPHVERAIPTSGPIDEYLRDRAPDAVLVTPIVEFGSSQVEYVKSARAAGIPCAVCVASWDNLTGKGLIRVQPDRVFVWNETQAREAVEMHGVRPDSVVATGSNRYDEWFTRGPVRTAAQVAERAGIDPEHPYLLYVCSSPFIAPDEVGFVRRWLAQLRRDERPHLAGLGAIVRPHPQNAAQWRDADLSDLGNVAVWPRGGAQPDAGEHRADFFDSLYHSAAVVGINTSALIEAAILGKGVLTPVAPEFAGTQAGTLHWHYLLYENGGFLHVGRAGGEHVAQLAAVIERRDEHADRTRRFVESFVRPHGLDRPAAPIFADAVEELARISLAPAQRAAGDLALQLGLTPLAVGAQVSRSIGGKSRPSSPTIETV
jgi:hypothetical protein